MILLSTSTPIRFVAPWREGEADAPAYLLRAGNVLERAAIEAELAGDHRAGRIFDFDLLATFIEGVRTLLGDDAGHGRLIDLAHAEAGGETLSVGDRQLMAEARDVMGEHWPDYRRLIAQGQRRREIAPLLAFRRFCVGWENVDAPFARGPDGMVAIAALAAAEPMELRVAGLRAYALLYPDGEAENSARPSSSESGPAISNSDEPSPADGKSKGKNGRKIPG